MKPWQQTTLGIFIGMLFLGVILLFVLPERGIPMVLTTKTPNLTPQPTATLAQIRVHVTGAVNNPGLVTLPKGARLADAIEATGGLIDGFDENLLNLSEFLSDGQRVYIPQLGEETSSVQAPNRGQSLISVMENETVNINTADFDMLCTLPGIGPTKAHAIIAYREQNGLFMNLEDLQKVSGIGPATFNAIKELITLGD